jgi:hypothetical protein
MKKTMLAAVAAVALMLPACDGGGEWVPTPGAEIKVGAQVTAAVPAPAGVDCSEAQVSITSLDDRPIFEVLDLPSPTTVTIRADRIFLDTPKTVDRRCVVAYALQD